MVSRLDFYAAIRASSVKVLGNNDFSQILLSGVSFDSMRKPNELFHIYLPEIEQSLWQSLTVKNVAAVLDHYTVNHVNMSNYAYFLILLVNTNLFRRY